jgi:predicted naringenin-chalcone synthase
LGNPRILALGTANPPNRFTQRDAYRLVGYENKHILDIFLNSDIDYRHFYLDPDRFSHDETSDELNQRYLRGAMETGCRAVHRCLELAGLVPRDVDLFAVSTCTGYLCPDLGSRLIGPMRFRSDVQRAPMLGLGCAGALPTLQRVWDFAAARPGRKILMLSVEICSASYYSEGSCREVLTLGAGASRPWLFFASATPKGQGFPGCEYSGLGGRARPSGPSGGNRFRGRACVPRSA